MRPALRWLTVPAVGAVLALWSVATMASLYSVGTSLTAASNGLPQSLLVPRTIALADPRFPNSWTPSVAGRRNQALPHGCDAGCVHSALSFAHDGKTARLRPRPNSIALVTSRDARFDAVMPKAELSPQKLAAAFARAFGHSSGASVMAADLPAAARFAGTVRLPDQHGPASVRFGPEVAEVERSSRLALALANALPSPSIALATADAPQEAEVQMASLPPQDDLPDSILLPNRRPQTEVDRPAEAPQVEVPQVRAPKAQAQKAQALGAQAARTRAARAQTADAPAESPKAAGTLSPRSASQAAMPGKPSKAQTEEMLAFAKPDMPAHGIGGAFRNLFSTPRMGMGMGSGVAVYDISAKTVYLPDGSRLEAHSGLGAMVDQPRYVNRKNTGPTPPDTYNLTLRETRFHGVEAIRLTPAGGGNKYGRNGLLAHTYMLRGGRAESNGCVVFKDYARFLAAYKKGKINRLVVVPRLSKPLTQVASDGRGA